MKFLANTKKTTALVGMMLTASASLYGNDNDFQACTPEKETTIDLEATNDCDGVFKLAIKKYLGFDDDGDFDRSFTNHVKSDAFREFLNNNASSKRSKNGSGLSLGYGGFSIGANFVPNIHK